MPLGCLQGGGRGVLREEEGGGALGGLGIREAPRQRLRESAAQQQMAVNGSKGRSRPAVRPIRVQESPEVCTGHDREPLSFLNVFVVCGSGKRPGSAAANLRPNSQMVVNGSKGRSGEGYVRLRVLCSYRRVQARPRTVALEKMSRWSGGPESAQAAPPRICGPAVNR